MSTSRSGRAARLGGLVAGQGLRWVGTRAANAFRSDERAREATARRTLAAAEELVELLGSMKGAAMKLGQVLSTVDLVALPEEERERVKAKLAELRDAVEPVPFSDVRKVIEADLGVPLREAFADVEEEAFAAASIGQVHRAQTHDGRTVAVKVQYPGVAEAVDADLRSLPLLFPLLRRLAPGLDLGSIATEVRERLTEELDYELEAQRHRRMARAFRGHPFVWVPAVDTALSGRRVLVTEYVEGRGFEEVKRLGEAERDRFGEIVYRFFFGTLARLSISLGDPHPGNYLLADDGRVAFLDFGLLREVSPEHLEGERALGIAIADGDAAAVFERMASLGYLPDPDAFEPESLLAQLRALGWMFVPDFRRLDGAYARELMEVGAPGSPWFEQMRRQTLPPESLLLRRMEGLLLSVLAELRAGARWGELTAEYLRDAPPSTPLGEQDAAFWARRTKNVQG